MADKDEESQEQERRREDARRKTITAAGIGVGLGIGSAALAAALMYARSGKPKKDDDAKPPRTSTAPKTDIQEGNHWTD